MTLSYQEGQPDHMATVVRQLIFGLKQTGRIVSASSIVDHLRSLLIATLAETKQGAAIGNQAAGVQRRRVVRLLQTDKGQHRGEEHEVADENRHRGIHAVVEPPQYFLVVHLGILSLV